MKKPSGTKLLLFLAILGILVIVLESVRGTTDMIGEYFSPQSEMVQLEAPYTDLIVPFGTRSPAVDNTIAVVELSGSIINDRPGIWYGDTINASRVWNGLLSLAEDPQVKALIIRLQTDGGEIMPSYKVREAIQYFDQMRGGQSTYIYVDGFALSAGVIIMGAASAVYVATESEIGNIGIRGGVCFEPSMDFLLKERMYIMSGAGKDFCFNHDGSLNYEAIEVQQREADEAYDRLIQLVASDRSIPPASIRGWGAKIMDSWEAEEVGLVDGVMGELTLRKLLRERHGANVQFVLYQDTPMEHPFERDDGL